MNHTILNVPLVSDIPDNAKRVLFGMGCFWGVERLFWQLDGVYRTAAGYAGGVMEILIIEPFVAVLQDIRKWLR